MSGEDALVLQHAEVVTDQNHITVQISSRMTPVHLNAQRSTNNTSNTTNTKNKVSNNKGTKNKTLLGFKESSFKEIQLITVNKINTTNQTKKLHTGEHIVPGFIYGVTR